MEENNLIKDIQPKSETFKLIQKYVLNKYTITICLFLVWMIFFDKTSFLVINELNGEIHKYEEQLEYYKKNMKKMMLSIKTDEQQIRKRKVRKRKLFYEETE